MFPRLGLGGKKLSYLICSKLSQTLHSLPLIYFIFFSFIKESVWRSYEVENKCDSVLKQNWRKGEKDRVVGTLVQWGVGLNENRSEMERVRMSWHSKRHRLAGVCWCVCVCDRERERSVSVSERYCVCVCLRVCVCGHVCLWTLTLFHPQ